MLVLGVCWGFGGLRFGSGLVWDVEHEISEETDLVDGRLYSLGVGSWSGFGFWIEIFWVPPRIDELEDVGRGCCAVFFCLDIARARERSFDMLLEDILREWLYKLMLVDFSVGFWFP